MTWIGKDKIKMQRDAQEEFIQAAQLLARYSMEDFCNDIWFNKHDNCAYLLPKSTTFLFYQSRYLKKPYQVFDLNSTLIRVPPLVYRDFEKYIMDMLSDALKTFVALRGQFSHLVFWPWCEQIPLEVLSKCKGTLKN